MAKKNLSLQIISLVSLTLSSFNICYGHVQQDEAELYRHPLFMRQRLHLEEVLVPQNQKLAKKVSFALAEIDDKSSVSQPKPTTKASAHERMDSVDCINAMGIILLSGWQVNGSFIEQVAGKVDEIDQKYAGTQKYLDAALRKAEIVQQEAANFHRVAALRHACKKAPRRSILTGSIFRNP